MGALHKDQYTCLILFHSTLLGMRNVSDKIYREDQNTHFFAMSFFLMCHYEIMWKNRNGQARDDNMAYAQCMLDS